MQLHDESTCHVCEGARRRRRRALIERWWPVMAIGLLVALMALGEALTSAVRP